LAYGQVELVDSGKYNLDDLGPIIELREGMELANHQDGFELRSGVVDQHGNRLAFRDDDF